MRHKYEYDVDEVFGPNLDMETIRALGQQNAYAQQQQAAYAQYYVGSPPQLMPQLPQYELKTTSNMQRAIKALEEPVTTKPKEKHMFGFAKEYTEKHKDSIMTIVVVLLVDYFFLGGALRQKIKAIAESALEGAQKKLSHTPNSSDATGKSNAA